MLSSSHYSWGYKVLATQGFDTVYYGIRIVFAAMATSENLIMMVQFYQKTILYHKFRAKLVLISCEGSCFFQHIIKWRFAKSFLLKNSSANFFRCERQRILVLCV